VDALVLNAGTQVLSADRTTQDGFELTFGVNHLAHFLLTTLLIDAGALVDGARVVSLGSGTHHSSRRRTLGFPAARWRDPRALAAPHAGSGRVAYATSKLAVILSAFELARSEPSLRSNAFDPGLVPATGLARAYPPVAQRVYDRLAPLIVRVASRLPRRPRPRARSSRRLPPGPRMPASPARTSSAAACATPRRCRPTRPRHASCGPSARRSSPPGRRHSP